MTRKAVHRVGLQFDDNDLVPLLFGEHGAHLNRIEEELGIEIASKGNELILSGTKHDLKTAQRVLDVLWERLVSGQDVSLAEVDAAIRLTRNPMDAATRELALHAFREPQIKMKGKSKEFSARSPTQAKYIEAIRSHDLVFGIGPAGTGKTFLAVAQAVAMMQEGLVDRLILCRPAVEAGEHLGFLPGDMQEKVDPYLRPIYDALHDMLPAEQIVKRITDGDIEIAPLAFMRGRTLSNAFIILDEAQNTTVSQMKMALTRIGEGSRMVITGDPSQTDLPGHVKSGLNDALQTLEHVKEVAVIAFEKGDVVRSRIVGKIVDAYEKKEKAAKPNGAVSSHE